MRTILTTKSYSFPSSMWSWNCFLSKIELLERVVMMRMSITAFIIFLALNYSLFLKEKKQKD